MKIKYVNAPKREGGKFGNIKMETGETFFVTAGNLNRFKVGMEIEPPSKAEKWGDNVVQVIPAHYDPAANTNAAPASTPPAPGHNSRQSGSVDKDAMIFVTGIVGRAMGSGKFDTQDIPLLSKAAVAAWNEIKGDL
jgi:hypothetical protein